MLQTVTQEQAVSSTNLNDVLNYIRTASPISKRVIEITLVNSGSVLVPKKPTIKVRLKADLKFAWFELKLILQYGIFNKLFYLQSFRLISLPGALRTEMVEYCTEPNLNVMEVQFVRNGVDYFKMLYKGEPTCMGYFISENLID